MRVTMHLRHPSDASVSIERVFADVLKAFDASIQVTTSVARFPRGLARRVFNMGEARLRQGEVNHIAGDIHYVALLLDRRRTLLTIMDCVSLHRTHGIRRQCIRLLWYAWPIRRARIVSVISECVRQEVLACTACDPAKVRVVYCPVSDRFTPAPRAFATESPVVLHVGTAPHKNLSRVIESLHGVPCHLRIIGPLSREHEASLRRYGVAHSAVARLSDDAIVDEYRNCDLLVFASTYEGFGLPIVEAQATGRPVVTSNLSSMPEVAGAGACLVDPWDVAGIRAGILRVIQDSAYRNQLIHWGYQNTERFRPTAIAAQYASLYAELHGGAREHQRAVRRAA